MNNLDWFEENGISKSLNKKKDVSKLSWNDLRKYAKENGVDLGKYRSREDIEAQLRRG